MNIKEILDTLPHRYPFILVDRVLSVHPHSNIKALKNVTINEQFFTGHFPHHPVMPGVLIIEALAQTAGILSFKSMDVLPDKNSLYYFVGIDNCRFKNPVLPGDTLILDVEIDRVKGGVWKYKAKASANDCTCAEATLLCALRKV
ncbi:MAG: 3-hydroxyacyl-[acyl-carrier-protein] dehydratase FabZ [Rickettsiales bacterium]|nr:3-hydroxyacyl-[acyl-carrier-protein] dehydratase FabZ [Rickettsiales bacterium]OUW04477.1 MAG: 3-hydroxyacyl-[acyl-carrier-protein] dehydratase FabZ [Betaproteobacteria bacterium TMED156]|tara:strand:- start:918 stop:1352 length:435 start_codon:yes stop_codon:yes gene_type:complete